MHHLWEKNQSSQLETKHDDSCYFIFYFCDSFSSVHQNMHIETMNINVPNHIMKYILSQYLKAFSSNIQTRGSTHSEQETRHWVAVSLLPQPPLLSPLSLCLSAPPHFTTSSTTGLDSHSYRKYVIEIEGPIAVITAQSCQRGRRGGGGDCTFALLFTASTLSGRSRMVK